MASLNAVRTLTVRGQSEGLDKVAADINRVADAQQRAATTSAQTAQVAEQSARRQVSASRAYDNLRQRLDETYRAELQFARGQATIERAVEQGAASAADAARMMELLRARTIGLGSANDNLAGTSRVASHHIQNLGFQLNDVATMLASGASPFQVLATQGGQIAQILGQTGVGGALRGIGGMLAGLLSPIALVGTAFAAVGAAAALALSQFSSGQKALEQSLKGVGAATGATVADLNRMAEAGAKAGNVTVSAARSMAAEFAKTGKIGLDNFDELIGITDRFARTVGMDVTEATQELAKAFSDPVEGADKLNETLGFLDDKTREHIRALVDQNDEIGAQRMLIDALRPAIDGAAASTTGLAGAWNAVTTAASNAFAAIGKAVNAAITGGTTMERVAGLQQRKAKIEGMDSWWLGVPIIGNKLKGELNEINAELAKLYRQDATDRLRVGLNQAAQEANKASIAAGKVVESLNPAQVRLDQLKAQRADIERALKAANNNDPFDTSANGMLQNRTRDINALKDAYNRLNQAITTMTDANGKAISSEQIRAKQEELSLRALQAKTPAQKEEIAREKAALDLIGETITAEEARGRVERAAAQARQQAASAAAKASKDERSAVEDLLARNEQRIEQMEMEAQGYGKSSAEVLNLRMQYELMRAAQRDGVTVTDEMTEAVRQQAERMAELQAAAKAAREEMEAQEFVLDGLKGLAEALLDASTSFDEALQNFAKTFQSAALDALLTGNGPLAGILGLSSSDGKSTGGLIGMLMGNDVRMFRDAVSKGTEQGVKGALRGTAGAAANDNANLFGIDGKSLMGGITALASLGAAYGGGLSAGSPMQGAVSGALSGGVGALSLAALPALAGIPFIGPILAIGGALLGGGLGFLGGSSARDKQKEQLREEAEANYQAAQPHVRQTSLAFTGNVIGSLEEQFQAGIDKLNELVPILINAGHADEATALQADYNQFVVRLTTEFKDGWEGTIADLFAGIGSSGPFGQARDAVKQFGDQAKSFIADTATAFGDGAAEVARATEASRAYALTLLDEKKTLSQVEQTMASISGGAAGLNVVLQKLGMSAEDAAKAIEERTIAAMDRLRAAFTEGLERRLNEAQDKGYLNEIADALAQYQQDIADATSLGLDRSLVDQVFKAEAQAIVNGAGLVGSAFDALIAKFPMLAGVVTQATTSIEAAVSQLEAAALAQLDTNVQEAQAAVEQARAALQAAYQAEASSLREVITRTEGYVKSLKSFRQSLLLDQNLSPLSPQDRLAEAQRRFNEVSQKALAGDADAIGELEDVSRQYLEEARGFYASSEAYYAIFNQVQSVLERTEGKAQSQLDTAKAQLDALDAQVAGLITVNGSVLSVAEAIAKLEQTQIALAEAQKQQQAGTGGTGAGSYAENYVKSLYTTILGRDADAGGLAYWTGLMTSGQLTTQQLYQAFIDAKANGAMRLGGIVGAYAGGGMVGNGIFDVDSVLARYAGGGSIALAGGEYVMPAHQTRANLATLEAMRAGRSPANDDSAKDEVRRLNAKIDQLTRVVASFAQAQVAATKETTAEVVETRRAENLKSARKPKAA